MSAFTDEDRDFLDELLNRSRAYGRRRSRRRLARGVGVAGIVLYAITRR